MPDLICLSPTHRLLTFDRSLPTVVYLFPQPFDEEENFRRITVIESGIICRGRVAGAVEDSDHSLHQLFERVWCVRIISKLAEKRFDFINLLLRNKAQYVIHQFPTTRLRIPPLLPVGEVGGPSLTEPTPHERPRGSRAPFRSGTEC